MRFEIDVFVTFRVPFFICCGNCRFFGLTGSPNRGNVIKIQFPENVLEMSLFKNAKNAKTVSVSFNWRARHFVKNRSRIYLRVQWSLSPKKPMVRWKNLKLRVPVC
jgi:hypothetical protein